MRPTALVLENFGSFRGRHDVDLADVDLFVLAGPTGAGKSTVIDAMTMALYGAVARYDDVRLVEPAINKLATQATVSLTFDTGGQRYVATRVLRRTPSGGATAAEVRLERYRDAEATDTLASGSREVSGKVTELLGLTFDEFCKTVVLPQGAFAQFLHGARKERNDMLVRLLGLEVYAQLGALARSRERALVQRVAAIDEALTPIAGVDDAAVAVAQERAAALDAVRSEVVAERLPALEAQREAGAVLRQRLEAATATADALAGVRRPDGVEEIAGRIRDADAAVREATGRAAEADAALDAARAGRAAAPDPEPLRALLGVDEELAGRREAAATAREAARLQGATAADAEAAARTAEAVAAEAVDAVRAIQREHAAHTLAEGLAAGDACPVCRTTLAAPPVHDAPGDLAGAERRADAAADEAVRRRRDAAAARTAADRADAAAAAAEERVAEDERRRTAAAAAASVPLAEGVLDRAEVERRLAAAAAAADALAAAERAQERARQALAAARAEREQLAGAAADAWAAFDRARDPVAALGAPPVDRDDLAAAWDAMVAWAAARHADAVAAVDAARTAVEDAREDYRADVAALVRRVVAAGVALAEDATPQQALDACAAAATTAQAEAAARAADRDRAAALRTERTARDAERQVADLVADLLRRDRFEQWLLTRLSARLVAGASRILDELTRGAFSLAVDDRGGFEVIDHLNADERRSAKTLSGGETFLASLALALALAEHVTELNRASGATLEALFLDEGFGALDPDTLDVVATAIEELAGTRLVGVVTHVRELAARLPHRFDVVRGPDGSQITVAPPDGGGGLG